MVKTITMWTDEVDEKEIAAEQILSQLGVKGGLLKNTIGIVACHYEFVFSGVFKAICDALPFHVVGTISSMQSTAEKTDSLLLTMMVMTSDDVEFAVVRTPSLESESGRVIEECYKAAGREESPALILTFAPFMLQNSGDDYVNVLSRASGGAACFGTLAVDDTNDFANCFMLCDGESYRDEMAMLLLYGDVRPRFYIASISEDRLLEKSAVVTKSAGPVIMEVNERPVMEYFDDLGLAKASEVQYALTSLPFMIDYNDGTPKVSKIFVMLTPEKYALCAGSVPQGSTLYIASTDKNDVMLTTGDTLDRMMEDAKTASGALVYSCVSRSMTLGAEQLKEMDLVRQRLGGTLPYMMGCSGGELCPTQVSEDKAVSRFHNSAFIVCLF